VIDIAQWCCANPGWLLSGTNDDHIGKKVKLVRESAEVQISEFASRLHTPIQFVEAVEKGVLIPSEEWLDEVIRVFGIAEYFFVGNNFRAFGQNEIVGLLEKDPEAIPEVLKILRARKVQREASQRLLS
jgi:transcriptional regulator with XRE-family HTH domain